MSQLAILGGKPIRTHFLPPFRPSIGEEEIEEVTDTLRSDWITLGPKTHKFEEMCSEYIGCKQAVAVSSCTAGLQLSLNALEVGEGDEVVTTPFTFVSTVNVIVHTGARPVLVDIDTGTYNIDPRKIADAVSSRTKALLPVHYAGNPCEMDEILEIAEKNDLWVIEDAAHAIGAAYKKKKIGAIGDLTSFSFYATKNVTTGEGGMVTTDNDELADRIRLLSLHGMSKDAWKRYQAAGSWYYEVLAAGYKCNMTDLQASIGIHQLKKLEQMQRRREDIARRYNEAFEALPGVVRPNVSEYAHHAWHLYPILLNLNLLKSDRNGFVEALKAENVGTSVHFIPVHLHPYYRDRFGFRRGDFPNSEYVYDREVSLPIYPRMSDSDVEDVIAAVRKVVQHYAA
jgi:dTDP-4-amino-4,6-dideoxygalactose transaminase